MNKLDSKEFKEFKALLAKQKQGKLTSKDETRLAELSAKRNEKMSNDIAWWNNYPELVKNVTNIAFNYIPGTAVRLGSSNYAFANLAVCSTHFSIGVSRTPADAFNAQMRQLWLDMHRKYRGIGGYQRSDLGMAIIAIVSLFTTLAKFERIYTVMNTYKIMNRSVPYALLEGLHIGKSLFGNLAQLRYELNNRIVRMQQLCLPKGIAAVESELTNALGIFKDSENPRAGLFCFDPIDFGVYDATSLSSGGCVTFEEFSSNNMQDTTPNNNPGFSLVDIVNVLDTQMNALLNDDDIAKMCSDIVAAYGPENVLTVGYIPENMVFEPVHDYERLLQFHNASIVGNVATIYDSQLTITQVQALAVAGKHNVIYQYNDIIRDERICTGHGNLSGAFVGYGSYYLRGASASYDERAVAGEHLFDTWVDHPGDVEIMCGTRFATECAPITSASGGGNTVFYQEIRACGLSIVSTVDLYVFDSTSPGYVKVGLDYQWLDDSVTPIRNQIFLTQFDWAPLLYIDETDDTGLLSVFGDVDNFAILDLQELEAIHTAAIYSAFKIPNVTYID